MTENKLIKDALASMEKNFLSSMVTFQTQLDGVKDNTHQNCDENKLQEIIRDFGAFKNQMILMMNEMKTIISHLDNRVDDLEQYSRRNCLLLHGVRESNGEDTGEVAVEFINSNLQMKGFTLNLSNIDRAHRIGAFRAKDGISSQQTERLKPRPIIIKFISYATRHLVWMNKRNLKKTKFLITESLTKKRMELYKSATAAAGPKNVWTADGKIFVATSNGKRAIVRDVDDLEKYLKPKNQEGRVTRSRAQPVGNPIH
ncbi:uncharacterized protein [Onthophagus taurus]|uniref:uncharacterized protein n=1 Tax=Onthophagus taurus TaxID=166361 RepID=UPI0039BEC7B7